MLQKETCNQRTPLNIWESWGIVTLVFSSQCAHVKNKFKLLCVLQGVIFYTRCLLLAFVSLSERMNKRYFQWLLVMFFLHYTKCLTFCTDDASFINQCIPFYDKSLEIICHLLFDQKYSSYIKIHMVKQKPFRKNSCALHFNYCT